ncbi:UNVERIFIED_CONTAM: hypothetical protein FKN15_041116 [Acipenser sinensis]
MQPPQSCSVGGQCSFGQLTDKPSGVRPDHRGHWCTVHLMRSKECPFLFRDLLLSEELALIFGQSVASLIYPAALKINHNSVVHLFQSPDDVQAFLDSLNLLDPSQASD